MSLTKQKKVKMHKPQSVFRWGLIVMMTLFVGLILFAFYAWHNRYNYAEAYINDLLSERGFQSEFNIRNADQHIAILDDFEIKESGKLILSAKTIRVEYDWRDAIEGKVKRVEVEQPYVSVTLDEQGRITDPWYLRQTKQSSASGPKFVLPPNGINIQSGQFDIRSAFGHVNGSIDLDYIDAANVSGEFRLTSSVLSYGDMRATLSGPMAFKRELGVNHIFPNVNIQNWSYRDFSGDALGINGQASLERGEAGLEINGELSLQSTAMNIGFLELESGDLDWNGLIILPRTSTDNTQLDGHWSANLDKVTVIDDNRRQLLAETISLNEVLRNAPVTQHFAQSFTNSLADLMERGSVQAEGFVSKPSADIDVELRSPLKWKSGQKTLIMRPSEGKPFYTFGDNEQKIDLRFEADYQGTHPMTFAKSHLVMNSSNGRDILGVSKFASNLQISKTWRSQTRNARPVRLAPMKARLNYLSTPSRRLDLSGAIDFDGDIPGGYVEGLNTQGNLVMHLDDVMRIDYAPKDGSQISIKSFENITDWRGENILFSMADTTNLFIRQPKGDGRLNAELQSVSATLIRNSETQSMRVNLETAKIDADISAQDQDWDIIGQGAHLTSDTLPSPGTDMTADVLDMNVNIGADQPMRFTLKSPKANAKTQLVQGKDLKIYAEGTPEDYTLSYSDGRVKFMSAQLPILPMAGDVRYFQNKWSGAAVTYLPLAESTPINVTYAFEDGSGTAEVDIVDLPFSPSDLQPQYLIPNLRGKIAEVEGLASAQIYLKFETDQPMQSSGTAQIKDMNLGTLPGPITGMNADLTFKSFFPLQTDGAQFLTMAGFDPGLPLENGEVRFSLIPEGVDIHSATWPLGDGFITLDPTQWIYLAPNNKMILRIAGVSLGQFVNNLGNGNLSATGDINGELPVVISGINVNVENGRLLVKDGGVIQYNSPQTNIATQQSEHAKMAFDALKNFKYQELEVIMNGPLDGNILIRMLFEGSNPDVLGGAAFRFNVGVEGELLNIARNFRLGERIGAEIVKSLQDEKTQLNVYE